MLEAVGHPVAELDRASPSARCGLGELAPGAARRLTDAEVERLRRVASHPRPRRRRAPPDCNGPPMRLIALRGANTVEANEPAAILAATDELMRALIERNRLDAKDLVSLHLHADRRTSTPSSRPSRRARWGSAACR